MTRQQLPPVSPSSPRTLAIALLFWSVVVVAIAANQPVRAAAADVTGGWVISLETSQGPAEPTLGLTQDGEKITGVYAGFYGDYPVSGTVKGREITFTFTMRPGEHPAVIHFSGDISADGQTMKGTADLAEMGPATWTAKRSRAGQK